ncbi:MAG: hypothetical protein ACRDQX_04345 [Pseudonocardiaceae bacterium]
MRIPRRPLTLRGRLIAALLVLCFFGLTGFAVTSVMLLKHSLQNQVDNQLAHRVQLERRVLERRGSHSPPRVPSGYLLETIFGPNGANTTLGTPPDQFGGPALSLATAARHADGAPFSVRDRADGGYWRVRAVRLPGRPLMTIALPLDREGVMRSLLSSN